MNFGGKGTAGGKEHHRNSKRVRATNLNTARGHLQLGSELLAQRRIRLRLFLESLLEDLLLRARRALAVLNLARVVRVKRAEVDRRGVDAGREGDVRAGGVVVVVGEASANADAAAEMNGARRRRRLIWIVEAALHAGGKRVNINGGARGRVVAGRVCGHGAGAGECESVGRHTDLMVPVHRVERGRRGIWKEGRLILGMGG